ncbi:MULTISPECIES: DUF2783 domain-containing protein [Chromobacteriaceae]|uniref:DUF2783 domain-containing protein n=2 Tax=Chromobacteriaceae TaxID=1499392 RepID=A0ABV0CNJ6_9NEIS|nr:MULTISPECIES: DUF2783 domain-containing protein [Chromobacteriaceae]AVG16787.1 hypothetical protein CFN79_13540 [Chromobacterium vaccinii]ERE13381.1 hypothetical protein O166_04415 [Pseudogulbenkiania ferrooxidans EGD-HP2]
MSGNLQAHMQPSADELFSMLLEAGQDLPDEQARLVDAQLLVLLASRVNDRAAIADAIATARRLAQRSD